MPARQALKCRICLSQNTKAVCPRPYHFVLHKGLGVQGHKNRHVCNYCHTRIAKGKVLALHTQLPIFNSRGIRQKGLFATRDYAKNEEITVYFGRKLEQAKVQNCEGDYVWYVGGGVVIDAEKTNCLGKYANHYVHGFFPVNCKLHNDEKNRRSIFKATKPILAGSELFWSYGKGYWQSRDYKITKTTLLGMESEILYRQCNKNAQN